jgi:hypothetical protein
MKLNMRDESRYGTGSHKIERGPALFQRGNREGGRGQEGEGERAH